MPSPMGTLRLVVGSHNMGGAAWDPAALDGWLTSTGAWVERRTFLHATARETYLL